MLPLFNLADYNTQLTALRLMLYETCYVFQAELLIIRSCLSTVSYTLWLCIFSVLKYKVEL
jgi:hypothetical protein